MIQAEREVIGALLTNAERINDVAFLTPEMFTDGRLGEMFGLFAKGAESHTDVMAALKDAGRREDLTYNLVMELLNIPMTQASIVTNAKLVRDDYRARKAKEVFSANVGASNVDAFIHEAVRKLQGLAVSDAREKTVAQIAEENEGKYFVPELKERLFIGFDNIDKALTGIDHGDVAIIAARPGVGKSAFALQVIRNIAATGKRIAYYNLEMNDDQVYERLLAAESGLALNRIRLATNFLGNESMKFNRANADLKEKMNIVSVITGSRMVDELRVNADKYDVIVVDYLQLLRSGVNRNGNRVAEVGDISQGLKNLATDFKIPVIALSQLNRASARAADKEPDLPDLRESGSLEQDASTVLMLWEPDAQDRTKR